MTLQYTRTITVSDERKPDQTLEDDIQGLAKRSKAEGIALEDMKLRETGDVRVALLERARAEFAFSAAVASNKEPSSKSEIEQQAWFGKFKARVEAPPQLHGVEWEDVEKSLLADPEAMSKLQILDAAGFEMNVFGEKNDEIQFRTAQTDVTKIAAQYRTIMADKKAQTDYPQYDVNGNAEDIAASLGVELADMGLYEQFNVKRGWLWLKTDAATRRTGLAFSGYRYGIHEHYAYTHNDSGSFCAALRVKKISA